jgi:hypothetical protein
MKFEMIGDDFISDLLMMGTEMKIPRIGGSLMKGRWLKIVAHRGKLIESEWPI